MASSTFMLRSALIILASVLATPAVLAHAHLTKQGPVTNAEVVTSPQALMLSFPEGIEPGFSGAILIGPNKEQIRTGRTSRSEQGKTQLIIPFGQTLEAGKHTVSWHVVSVDGHKAKGQYTFSVK